MFGWLTRRKRRKLTAVSFPPQWEAVIRRNIRYDSLFDETERRKLRKMVQVFVAEKNWEGCGGLELTDEIRITISAMACILILNIPHNSYNNVETIIVYPSEVVPPQRKPGFFEVMLEPLETPQPLSGQAFHHGPLILAWDAVLEAVRYPGSGYNVVYHEFAHKLDMQDGVADGTPLLGGRKEYRDWVRTFSGEYLKLLADVKKGRQTFLDEYGATDEAEFFAVATEHFFDQPLQMKKTLPELYRVLKDYYRQDPAKRIREQPAKEL